MSKMIACNMQSAYFMCGSVREYQQQTTTTAAVAARKKNPFNNKSKSNATKTCKTWSFSFYRTVEKKIYSAITSIWISGPWALFFFRLRKKRISINFWLIAFSFENFIPCCCSFFSAADVVVCLLPISLACILHS